jgi:hypothetical protein
MCGGINNCQVGGLGGGQVGALAFGLLVGLERTDACMHEL